MDKVEKDSFGSGPPLTWLTSPPPTSQSDRSPRVFMGAFYAKLVGKELAEVFSFQLQPPILQYPPPECTPEGRLCRAKAKFFSFQCVNFWKSRIG